MEGHWHGLVAGKLRKVRVFFVFFLKIQLSKTGRTDWSMWRNGNVIKNRSRIKKIYFIHLGHTVK